MCVGDLVLFDPSNRTKCSQLSGGLNCAWSVPLLWKAQGQLGTHKGGDAAPETTRVQLCSFLAISASEPVQLFSKGAWVAALKLWVQTSVSLYHAVAGDWCKSFDIVFSGTSMDLRGLTSLATCWLLLGIPALCYLVFIALPPHPAVLLQGFLENWLYPETGFS